MGNREVLPRIWKCGTAFGVDNGRIQSQAPRVPLRYALPGGKSGLADSKSAERQRKEKLVHTSTTPVHGGIIKCGDALLTYCTVRRTRYAPASLHRTDHGNLRICGQPDTDVSGWPPKRLFLPPCTAHSFSAPSKKNGGCILRLPVRETALTPRQRSPAPSAAFHPRRI